MQTITASELKTRKNSGEELYILDVREQSEYDQVNMGAKLIPLGKIANGEIDEIEDWKDKEVIIHCRSGVRSMQACMILEQHGFSNTVNLTGGILAYGES
jgi:rhodanese-related sulfurtransferase